MRQGIDGRRTSRRTFVLCLTAAIALLLAGPRVKPVAGALSPVYSPVGTVVGAVTSAIGDVLSTISRVPVIDRENARLRARNARLTRQLAMLSALRRENAALGRQLRFRDLNPHLVRISARVIGTGTPGITSVTTLDVGSNAGVRSGDAVLDANGFLAGKITSVSPASAAVELLTSNQVAVPAMDSKSGARGIVDVPEGQSPHLDDVLTGRALAVGDHVVTSGLGREFPIGLYIGRIVSVRAKNVLAMQSARLKTAADLNNLYYVQVILRYNVSSRINYPRHLTSGLTSR